MSVDLTCFSNENSFTAFCINLGNIFVTYSNHFPKENTIILKNTSTSKYLVSVLSQVPSELLQELNCCPGFFQLLEHYLFWLLHVLATRIDGVISTASLHHNIAIGHRNLVLVVELIILSGNSRFSLNEAVGAGVSDLYPSLGNSRIAQIESELFF